MHEGAVAGAMVQPGVGFKAPFRLDIVKGCGRRQRGFHLEQRCSGQLVTLSCGGHILQQQDKFLLVFADIRMIGSGAQHPGARRHITVPPDFHIVEMEDGRSAPADRVGAGAFGDKGGRPFAIGPVAGETVAVADLAGADRVVCERPE